MKKHFRLVLALITVIAGTAVLSSFNRPTPNEIKFKFPYEKAGLTKHEAAAHLINRFTFGPTPGEVEEVEKMGLEKWFEQQLDGNLPDDSLNAMLSGYESLNMTNQQIVQTFPRNGQILKMAIQEGIVNKDSIQNIDRKEVRQYMMEKGYKPEAELYRQLINQKILRAEYSNNQLREVLTSFWFNHFNVSLTKGEDQQFITTYERDVIRPNVFGRFEDILLATAKSPAMLTYLDNFRSIGPNEKFKAQQERRQQQVMKQLEARQAKDTSMQKQDVVNTVNKARRTAGLNENYAREIMELHTLGVDGGYTQTDVTQAARVLTGWTIFPVQPDAPAAKQYERQGEDKMKELGFVHDGDFLFAANNHDTGEKHVLGSDFPEGGGYDEGLKLIHILATHPSTAKFISKKLAVRFVSDNPPQSLIDKMAKTFIDTKGDIREVLITMVTSPEFWSKDAVREKTKSPFDLAISATRSVNAKIDAPYQLYNWINRMGEKIYYYQAPTGFPDKGQYWINTGSLLNRMNFGLALASQRIPGVRFNLAELNNNHEPESADAALKIYSKLLLPGRNVDETIKRLTPMLNDPALSEKLNDAANRMTPNQDMNGNSDMMKGRNNQDGLKNTINKKGDFKGPMQTTTGNNTMLAQVVGIIIGSPEFQRK